MLFTTDTLFSKVRQTSHKPDEIYGVIERLSPGTRKIGKQVLHAFMNGLQLKFRKCKDVLIPSDPSLATYLSLASLFLGQSIAYQQITCDFRSIDWLRNLQKGVKNNTVKQSSRHSLILFTFVYFQNCLEDSTMFNRTGKQNILQFLKGKLEIGS